MPQLGRGMESIRFLLSQTSKYMHKPLVPMLFPILGAQISGSELQHPDLNWKELCGIMAYLVADSGCFKGYMTEIYGDMEIIPYACNVIEEFFEHDVNDPGKGSLSRTENISDTL